MSRTLNRPMFRRGGKVDSRGTGITSGLMPRQNYQNAGFVFPGDESKTTPTTQPTGGGTGFSQSPFKKLIVDPTLSAISPVVNVGSDIGNFTKLFFGGDPTFKYLDPFAKGSGFGVGVEDFDTFRYGPNKKEQTTTELPEAPVIDQSEDNQQGDKTVTMDEKKDAPEVQDNNKAIDVDAMEDLIDADAKTFERIMLGDSATKDKIFKMLTAAAPKILEEDYGGAIAAAGEAGDDSAIKAKSREAAVSKYISDTATTDKQKDYAFIKNKYPNMSEEDAIAFAGGQSQYQKELPLSTVRATITSKFEPSTLHEQAYEDGYIEYLSLNTRYGADLKILPYKSKGKSIEDGFEVVTTSLDKSSIYFDPVSQDYIVADKETGQSKKFNTFESANSYLKS